MNKIVQKTINVHQSSPLGRYYDTNNLEAFEFYIIG